MPDEIPRSRAAREAAERALTPLRSTIAKREPAARVDTASELWRLRAASRWRDKSLSDVGWLLLDPKGRPLWLEAWPDSTVKPLPAPAPTPGGRGTDEDPHDRKGGAMTKLFLERFLERRRKLEAAADARK